MVDGNCNSLIEYKLALEDAVLFDLSNHGLVSCVGKDAGQFLHNLCTNEVVKLAAGRASEAFLTTAQAKVVDHVWILNIGGTTPSFLVDVGENEGPRILKHLDRFLISEQLELLDLTESLAHYHFAGPKSCRILTEATGKDLAGLLDLEAVEVKRDDHLLRIWRRNRLGVIGFDLICQSGDADFWLQLLDSPPLVSPGCAAFDCLRIEAGLPRFGVDITEGNLPQEVGRIENTISFTKGCYIGQETVARVRSFGHVNRTLLGLLLAENKLVDPGTKVFHENEEAGVVTSCTYSPRLDRAIALAYVRRGHDSLETKLSLGKPNADLEAAIASLPFVAFVPAIA